MHVSLDGYFEGPEHDISWAHTGSEAFSLEDNKEVDTLLFGHKTYELMRAFWPTQEAAASEPELSRFMNENRKLVASHEPFEPGWDKVTVLSDDVAGEIRKLKEQPGKDIIILGSNNLCVSLMQEGLIDEFQIVVNPVVLGQGTSLFAGLLQKADLTLKDTRQFKFGAIMLTYVPVQK